jgi:hypothetical protein
MHVLRLVLYVRLATLERTVHCPCVLPGLHARPCFERTVGCCLQMNGTALVIGEWSAAGPVYIGSDWRARYDEFTRQQVEAFSQPGILANTAWSARVDYNAMWGLIS